MRQRALAVIIALLTIILPGCGQGGQQAAQSGQQAAGDQSAPPEETPAETPAPRRINPDLPLRIFASDSLNSTLPVLAKRYKETHDGKELSVTFVKSAELAERLANDPAADLLLCDDADLIRQLKLDNKITGATAILAAQLIVITNAERPTLIATGEDLRSLANVQIGIPAAATPAGAAARAWLQEQTLLNVLQPKLKEYESVAAVVRAVGSGEVPLGFAYASAIRGRRQVKSTLACGLQQPPEIIAAPLAGAQNSEDAEGFVQILREADSIKGFVQAGFAEISPRVIY